MSFIHNHSFYTTMDTLCRNMTMALNICDKTTHHQSPGQNTWSVKEISKDFSDMFKSVTDGYAHMAPPTTLQSTANESSYDTVHTTHNDSNNDSQDPQHHIESVIAKAMNIASTDNQEHTQEGGIPFRHKQSIDEEEEVSNDELTQDSDDTSGDESSLILEDMLPGQRENYFKTKQMAEGIRQAQMMDEKYFRNC